MRGRKDFKGPPVPQDQDTSLQGEAIGDVEKSDSEIRSSDEKK